MISFFIATLIPRTVWKSSAIFPFAAACRVEFHLKFHAAHAGDNLLGVLLSKHDALKYTNSCFHPPDEHDLDREDFKAIITDVLT